MVSWSAGEDRADDHRCATSRTVPGAAVSRTGRAWWRCRSEQAPSEHEPRGATRAGEVAKLPNADEATWQHVLDEAPEKLHRGERHRAPLIAVRVILPLKGHTLAVEGDQAVVADRDAMGVAPEVPQHG